MLQLNVVGGKIKQFSSAVIHNDCTNAIKYGCELIDHNYFDDFWITCFGIMVEYTHIFLPNGPSYLYTKYVVFNEIQQQFLRSNHRISLDDVIDIVIPVIEILTKKSHGCNNYDIMLSNL